MQLRNTRLSALIFITFSFGAASLGYAPRMADATILVAQSDAALTAAADVVLTGTVSKIRSVRATDAIRTFVTLDVAEVLKGRVRNPRVTIREAGGEVDGLRQWIHGTPEFSVGESVLLFLTRRADGTLGTTSLGLGKFRVLGDAVGIAARAVDAVVIGGPTHETRSLRGLRIAIARAVAAAPARFEDAVEQPAEAEDDSLPHAVVSGFTFLGPGRWNEADEAETIEYLVDQGGEPALGATDSVDAVAQAMAAWNDVPTATIVLAVGGTAPARPMACDGVSQIVFNDPYGDVPDPAGCSGILALGGFCGNSSRKTTVGGVQFIAITEANITFNNGFSSCSFWNRANVEEVLTHEIGHSIGLGHSSERSLESDPTLSDATMYYRAHFDGRAASVRPDDVNAVSAVYPGCEVDDPDCDGVATGTDNCPAVANGGQIDTDGDGAGDMCDNCPTLANADQAPVAGCGSVAVSNLVVTRSAAAAKDRLRLRGSFSVDPAAGLDVTAGPVTFLLADAEGNLLSQDMSAQASRSHGGRVRFRYGTADGSLRIKIKSRDGVYYKLSVSGRQLSLEGADAAPILTTVGMGTHAVSTVLSQCDLVRHGRRLVCAP